MYSLRNAVRVGLNRLENVRVGGGTYLNPALTEVSYSMYIISLAKGNARVIKGPWYTISLLLLLA